MNKASARTSAKSKPAKPQKSAKQAKAAVAPKARARPRSPAPPAPRKPASIVGAAELLRAELESQVAAIGRAHLVLELRADGTVFGANDNFLLATGYALDELRGQHHAASFAPAARDSEAYRAMWARLERGESTGGVQLRLGKDGRELWLHSVCSPVVDAAGHLQRVIELSTDVTESARAAEEVRRELEVRTRIMNETSIVSMADKKGDILSFNQKYLDISKYSPEELIGSPHSITRHPDMPKEVFKKLWGTIGRGEVFRGVIKNRAKDGTPYYVDAVIAPFIGKNGKPEKYLGVRYDITQAEIERQNMKGIMDALNKSQAIIEFDLTGNILHANPIFCRALGYTLEEIRGQHHSMFVEPAFRSSTEYQAFWDKLGRGEYDTGQYKRIGKGGGEVWIQASYNPICDEMGRPFKVVKYATDISAQVRERAQTEAAVVQTQAVVMAAREGDLSQRIPMDGKQGSIGELCGGVNAIIESMAGVVGGIQQATEAIKTAANEIANGNNDLSARTEQQAASLEETASSMEELTSTVKQNAENAKQANQLAMGASDVARRGGQVVSEVVTTMSAINESSKKIVDIISVIDGIAFQTNILALNAAVEAARAGEQGRGFAVVAAEVRSLAQRSAAAAKEIKGLIGDSVEKVGNGSKLVEQAGRTMDEIVTSVKRVTDIMSEISAASQEQSQGIEQVNQTVTQMDEVTQQNAALVEEASAAARSLEEQAFGLAESVSQFRLEEMGAPVAKPQPRVVASVAAPKPVARPIANKPMAAKPAPARLNGTHSLNGKSNGKAHAIAASGAEQWTEF